MHTKKQVELRKVNFKFAFVYQIVIRAFSFSTCHGKKMFIILATVDEVITCLAVPISYVISLGGPGFP